MENSKRTLPKIVIHAGRHKTGTTSIQGFLGLNEDLLASDYGILYSSIGRKSKKYHHHGLFRDFASNEQPLDRGRFDAIIDEAYQRKCHTILLSSEVLSEPKITDAKLLNIKDFFSNHNVEIILYLRRQDDFQVSRYAQEVKQGRLKKPNTIFNIEQESLDYFSFVERYRKVFGKDSLIVKGFEVGVRKGIYEDFLSIFNVDLSSSCFCYPKKSLNVRYSWRHLEVIRSLHSPVLEKIVAKSAISLWLFSFLNEKFPKYMDGPKPLTETQVIDFIDEYRGSNKKLERDYFNGENLFD